MNVRTTLMLLVVLIVLGAFLMWERTQPPTPVEKPGQQAESVVTTPIFTAEQFPKDDVQQVKITRDGREVVLAREGSDWRQVAPVRFPLNNWSARQVADDAADLKYTEKLTPGGKAPSLADLKLEPPAATVTVTFGKDKGSRTIKVGRKTLGGRGYVMVGDGKEVYVVNDALHKLVLEQKVEDWRKKSLTGPAEGKSQRVVLKHGDMTATLLKADGAWSFAPPHSGRVATKAITDLLSAVGGIYIDKFRGDQPSDLSMFGLDQPRITLTVASSTAAKADPEDDDHEGHDHAREEKKQADKAQTPVVRTLCIGAPVDPKAERYFATWAEGEQAGDVVFSISKTEMEKFQKSVDDLRDPRVTPIAGADVTELAYERDGEVVKLLRTPDGWTFGDPTPGYAADHGQVGSLVDDVTAAEARSYQPGAKPEGEPLVKVTLTATGRPAPDLLRVFPDGSDKARVLVMRNQETTGYLVARDKFARLLAPTLTLRERTIADFNTGNINEVKLTRPDGIELVFTREFPAAKPKADDKAEDAKGDAATEAEPGPWKLAGQDRFEEDALRDLLQAFAPLHASGWITDEAKIGGKVIQLNIADVKGTKLALKVDPATRHAAAEGVDAAFAVSEDMVKKLDAEFLYRTVMDVKADQIAMVKVADGATTLELSKSAGGDYEDAGGAKLDTAAVGGLFDTLAGLRIERYIAPRLLKDDEVARRIEVVTSDGRTLSLVLSAGEDDPLPAGMGERWFTLRKETAEKLTKKLVKSE